MSLDFEIVFVTSQIASIGGGNEDGGGLGAQGGLNHQLGLK